MGFEAYTRAEEMYQADVAHLNEIAINVHHGDRGSFLKAIADAWLKADPSNKRILMPAWAAIVTKYDLEEDLEK